ncbi:MAG: glycosyltransferase [Flammeovirgaceae bacterium]
MQKLISLSLFLVMHTLRVLSIVLSYVLRKKSYQKQSIVFLESLPTENAGYHYRAKLWSDLFLKNEMHAAVWTIIEDRKVWDVQFRKNTQLFLLKALLKRFIQVIQSRKFATVIVRRELLVFNDYGNLFLEKFLLSIHPNVILDFDDDISSAKNQPREINNTYGKLMLEHGNKFNASLQLYHRFIVASTYLKDKVLRVNSGLPEKNVLVIPTCVDYDKHLKKSYPAEFDQLVLGWIGSDYNYFLIDQLLPVLNRLSEQYPFKLLVIGGSEYQRETNFEIAFIPWQLKTEIENLYKIDVGLMPLVNDAESRGKGGFKLIQYMGLGIVSIASAITINCEIIDHEVNSILAKEINDWDIFLEKIFNGEYDLRNMGQAAREKIQKGYSFESNKTKYMTFVSANPF